MNILIVLPALALALGVTVSAYLFLSWLRHEKRPKFILFWAMALFLMYWFQLPMILTRLGGVITVTDFNLFFALTLPITFIALMLLYFGLVGISGVKLGGKAKLLLGIWLLSSIVFFASQFITQEGVIKTYSLPLVGNLAFYLPMRILIILTALRWFSRLGDKTTLGILGIAGIVLESLLGIVRNLLIIKNVLAYPPEFWYVVISSLNVFFILQTFSIISLALGFFFVHRAYCCQAGKTST